MIARLRLAAAVLLGVCLPTAARAVPVSQTPRKVVVVVANRLLLEDLVGPSLQGLDALIRGGAAGLVSPNCVGFKSEASIMLTAAAGVGCKGGSFVRECYDADEIVFGHSRAADEYALRTGFDARKGSAVFLGLGQALRANAHLPVPARLGALGDAVRDAGGRTCVIGNADTVPGRIDRSAAVLATDSSGLADLGMLRWTDKADGGCPACAAVPNPTLLAAAVRRALGSAEIVVVDFGCTRSLDETRMSFAEDAYVLHRAHALRALDRLAAELSADACEQGFTLALVSFSPPAADWAKRLTPIVVYGRGVGRGLLTSPTTRTPGLIAAADFAPTILSLAGVRAPVGVFGRPAVTLSQPGGSMRTLRDLDQRSAVRRRLVAPVIWVVAALGALGLGGAAVALAFPFVRPRGMVRAARLALLLTAAAPVSMLLAPLAPPGEVWHVLACAGWLAALSTACHLLAREKAVAAAFALTAAVVVVDCAAGGYLCRFALPSSFQLSGLRYYGIGNEYAGVLISTSALAVLFCAAGRAKGWIWAAGVGAVVTAVLATGSLGANYGGTIASAVTFGLLARAMKTGRFGARHVAGFAALGVIVVIVMAVMDARLAGIAGSHAGRLTGIVEATGWTQVPVFAGRKLLLNLRLAVSGSAVKAYLIFLPFIVLWFARIRAIMHKRLNTEGRMVAGLKSVAVGAAAAAVVNDSGIVMAAIMLAMLSVMISYSLMGNALAGEGDG